MTPPSSSQSPSGEPPDPFPTLAPLIPPVSKDPPSATAPSWQPDPPSVTGLDDTCPLPLIQLYSPPAAPPAGKPRRTGPWAVGGIVLALLVIGIIAGGEKSSTSRVTTAEPPAAAAAPVPAAKPPAPATPPVALVPPVDLTTTTAFGDGTYIVGTDIVPGTYETTGPAAGGLGLCAWSRLKDTSGNFDSIIANDAQQGPTTVTISKTDGAFKTAGCNPWQEVVSLDPRPATG